MYKKKLAPFKIMKYIKSWKQLKKQSNFWSLQAWRQDKLLKVLNLIK